MSAAEYNVTLRVRNNWLLKKMSDAGYQTQSELARATGLSYMAVNAFLNFKVPPYTQKGEIRKAALAICGALNATPEELWPPNHRDAPMRKNSRTMELSASELGLLLEDHAPLSAEQLLLTKESDEEGTIGKALSTLTPREERLIRLRYGLGDTPEHTLDEIAKLYGVGRERIRQIENTALRKLKHPTRAKRLIDQIPWVENLVSRQQAKRGETTVAPTT